MDGNILITAFITLPIAEAIIGKEVSGLVAFSREEIKTRLKALNGQSASYKVAELEIPKENCKICGRGIMIPQTVRAKIKDCHNVEKF